MYSFYRIYQIYKPPEKGRFILARYKPDSVYVAIYLRL